MPIERFNITDRASWLGMRQSDITASVAGALLGVHEFQTPYGLWALKTGAATEDAEESAPMRRGRLLEPLALQLLKEERPTWDLRQNAEYFRDPDHRIGGTPDVIAFDPSRGMGIIQVKTVEPMVFRQKWRDPETGEVEVPVWIAVQAIVEASLTGAAWANVAAVRISHGVELDLIEVPIHLGVLDRLREAVREFWAMIERGETPSPDYARDGDLIERLFRNPQNEAEIDLSGDNEIPALLDERKALSTQKGSAEKRLKQIKAELLHKLGDHVFGRSADGRLITAKTVHRGAYSVEPTSYRDLRIKGEAA